MDLTMPKGTVRRIELRGEYDLGHRKELSMLFGALSPGDPIVIDLAAVTYVDSTFLSELGKLHVRLKKQEITLVGVSPALTRLLKIVGFDHLFAIVPT